MNKLKQYLAKEKDLSDIQKFYIKKFGVVPSQEKTIPLHTEKQMLDFAEEWHSANTPVSGLLPKLAGYLFNGRFYKNLDELRGRTMSEDNKPIEVFFGNDR